MQGPIRVYETPTAETLFVQGYVLANPDLEKAFGFNEGAARNHFELHGRRELRKQLTAEFVEWRASTIHKTERFQRFKDCFAPFHPEIKNFPVYFGDQFEDISGYQSESAHGTAGEFSQELTANPNKLYADIGAGLRDEILQNCIYVEVYPSLTT